MALTNPKYELAQSVRTPFSVKNKNTPEYNKENIFEVQYREKPAIIFSGGQRQIRAICWQDYLVRGILVMNGLHGVVGANS
jgi:hypothetical protein